jgi:hypothetical protein
MLGWGSRINSVARLARKLCLGFGQGSTPLTDDDPFKLRPKIQLASAYLVAIAPIALPAGRA